MAEHDCGECRKFKRVECTFYTSKVVEKNDPACVDFEGGRAPPKIKDEHKRKSQADKLVQLIATGNVELFYDQYHNAYAAIDFGNHREIHSLKSRAFKRWLTRLLWVSEGKAPNSEAVNSALNVLEAKATFEGELRKLHNRVAWHDDAIYYDLTDRNWRAVKITPEGWEIVDKPPILFKRYAHQLPQATPIKGGKIEKFLDYVNIKKEDHKTLFLSYLPTALVPDIPHAVPNLYGPQGCAKTTFFKLMKELLDSSAIKVLTFPRDKNELIQMLDHHWIALFDNVSNLPTWVSDALCRAVSGEGFSKRELYTDDDDFIYSFMRCVGLNGINLPAHSPDLLDRSMLIGLEDIPEEKRTTERELWSKFRKEKGALLGAVFDALAGAMREKERLSLNNHPRMADFAEWGEATSRAIGNAPRIFLSAYYRNISAQNIEAIEAHPIGPTIIALIESADKGWEGTASELLVKLEELAEDLKVNTKAKGWPKAANALTRRLKEIETNLKREGIEVIFDRESGKTRTRKILIQRVSKKPSEPSQPSEPERSEPKTADDIKDDTKDDKLKQPIPSDKPSEQKHPPSKALGDKDDKDDILHISGIGDKAAPEIDQVTWQNTFKEFWDQLSGLPRSRSPGADFRVLVARATKKLGSDRKIAAKYLEGFVKDGLFPISLPPEGQKNEGRVAKAELGRGGIVT